MQTRSTIRGSILACGALAVCLAMPGAPARAAAAAAAQVQDAWVIDWLKEYAAGRQDAIAQQLRKVASLRQLQDNLEKVPPKWLGAAGSPDLERRTLAAFALEAAFARLDLGASATKLIEWGCRQIRRNPKPDEFDRRWHWAAVAALEGAVDPDVLETHVGHVRLMFPGERRLGLVRGVAEELRAFLGETAGKPVADIAGYYGEAARRFEEASREEGADADPFLRMGHALLKLDRFDPALEALKQVEGRTRDSASVYLARLFTGLALDGAGRNDAAREAYQRALAIRPDTQSATVAMAALLFRTGHESDADELAGRLIGRADLPDDPWRLYWPGDFRFADRVLGAMREALK